MSNEYKNLPVHNMTPVGKHIEIAFDDSKVFTGADLFPDVSKKNSFYLACQLKDGDATSTVDGETDPVASGLGRPLVRTIPFTLSQAEARSFRIIAKTGQAPTFVGQLYYYTETK